MTIKDVINAYFPEDTSELPFFTADEQMAAWGRFLDLLIALSFNSIQNDPEENLNRISSFMSDREDIDLFAPWERARFEWKAEIYELFSSLLMRGYDDDGEPLFALSKLLGVLSDYEKWLVIFAYIGSSSAKYDRLINRLQENKKTIAEPTVGLAWDLARFFLSSEIDGLIDEPEWIGHEEVFDHPYMPASSFVQSLFMVPGELEVEKQSLLSRPLRLSPTVEAYLSGGLGNDMGRTGGASDGMVTLLPGPADDVYIAQEETLRELVLALYGGYSEEGEEPFLIELCGEEGSGKRFLLAQAAGALNMRVLAVDAGRVLTLSTEIKEEACRDMVLKSMLYGWQLYVYNVPTDPREYENEL